MCAQPTTGKASDLVQQWVLGRRTRVHVPTVSWQQPEVYWEERWLRVCILGTWKILEGLYDKEAGVVPVGGDRTGRSIELVHGVRRGRWWLHAFVAKAMWIS